MLLHASLFETPRTTRSTVIGLQVCTGRGLGGAVYTGVRVPHVPHCEPPLVFSHAIPKRKSHCPVLLESANEYSNVVRVS